MTHIDLFSGIGGFALAAQKVWGEEYKNLLFCDYDKFCQNVIRKNFPGSIIFGDIRELTAGSYVERLLEGKSEINATKRNEALSRSAKRLKVDLLTGGFPCQPFSQAGQRKGTADDRYLWPEMLRVIQEFSPRWIIGENVGGLVTWSDGLVLRQVFTDLEGEGYEVQAFIIPAVSVNAPHRRDRVWIIAHDRSDRPHGRTEERDRIQKRKLEQSLTDYRNKVRSEAMSCDTEYGQADTDSECERLEGRKEQKHSERREDSRADWSRD